MAVTDQRWLAASAKTASALLADPPFLQNLWHQRGCRAFADRSGNRRHRRLHVSNRRTTARLLARFSGWSDLSFLLRHVSFGTNHHAGAGLQHFCRRRDVLRDLWLPTPSTSRDMVRWLLGLRGFCLRDQKYSRVGVSQHHSLSARNFLPRSPSSISCSFPLAAFVDLSFDGCALVHLGRAKFPRGFSPAGQQ